MCNVNAYQQLGNVMCRHGHATCTYLHMRLYSSNLPLQFLVLTCAHAAPASALNCKRKIHPFICMIQMHCHASFNIKFALFLHDSPILKNKYTLATSDAFTAGGTHELAMDETAGMAAAENRPMATRVAKRADSPVNSPDPRRAKDHNARPAIMTLQASRRTT